MKATGIVRRIDDLGRIVIPKEIRKTLKVKEGMPLEIYTDKEGGIILRKFLPFSEMSSLSEEFAQCVAQQMGNAVFVTDREKVVAAAGYTGEEHFLLFIFRERYVKHKPPLLEDVFISVYLYSF